jgi:hypothetical protein
VGPSTAAARNVGRARTAAHLALIGSRPPEGSLDPPLAPVARQDPIVHCSITQCAVSSCVGCRIDT